MKPKLRILVEYLSAFVLIILLLLAITSVVAVKFYGNDLKLYVMEVVNDHIDTKINVEEINVKVFQKFPNTSLRLEGVTVWSSHNFDAYNFSSPGADTLLAAKTVNVSFNLLGLIRKKYNIRQLEIKDGILHLYTDRKGEVNFKVSSREGRKNKGDQLINLGHVKIVNFQFILDNQAKQLTSAGDLEHLDLNGRFSKRNTQIKGSLTGWLGEISNKGILYASDRDIEASLNLDVQDSLYTIKSGQIQLDRILADMDGTFLVHPGRGVDMNLYAAARDLEIHEVLDLLPSEISKPLQGIRGNGILQLYTRITGMVSSTLTPRIEADFQTSNANLSWDRLPFSMKSLNLTGTYSNGGEFNPVTTSLIIESLSAVIGSDHLTASGRIHNFYDPDFSFKLKGDIHPEQWLDWYESIPLHKASGTIISDVSITGSYDRLKPKGEKFLSFDFSGGMALEDVTIVSHKNGLPLHQLNGTIHIDNDFWEPSLSGYFGKSDFNISGSGLNLISFLMKQDETLVASASLRTKYLDLQEILDNFSRAEGAYKPTIHFPKQLNLKLDFVINEFSKDRFEARNVRGIATYDAPLFHADSLTMQTMEGTLRGDYGMTQNAEGNISMNVDAHLSNLDITQLFYSFNNFGQSQISHEHLKGTISGNCLFSANFDSTFSIYKESILSENSVTIRNGELNGFSPIMALSRFIDMEELQNIKFETLENNVLIRENQVIIPVMDIQTNALNLSASGTHGFNNHYDYRLKLKLSELLYKKARGRRNSEFNVAADDSDTRTLFLKVTHDENGSHVEMDREQTAQKIRNDLKEEKNELKQILNEELGLFSKDEGVLEQENQTKEDEGGFRFEFNEEPDSAKTVEKKEKGRWRKKQVKKDSTQNKPAVKFVIDE
jgi:hypothetical protein